jgi:GNAT superfamily N-acetyltransferase
MITISPARPGDLETILSLRCEAARWIASTGGDQWQEAWPTPDEQSDRIAASIAAGETWMLHDGHLVAGTVAIDEFADAQLWTQEEQSEPAYYVHRLIVPRAYAGQGLGAQVLNWCADRAARHGKRWIRVDIWTTNIGLQQYYLDHGFEHVRTLHIDYPSGALFQRRAARTSTHSRGLSELKAELDTEASRVSRAMAPGAYSTRGHDV